jgi:acyl carrier protein
VSPPREQADVDEIRKIIRQFILEHFLPGEGPDDLSDDSDLKEDGVLDSLSTLKLVSFLEERFGIDFVPEDLGHGSLSSIRRIEALVKGKMSTR